MELINTLDDVYLLEKGRELLDSNPRVFMDNLRHLIKYGEEKCTSCILLIELLAGENKSSVLLLGKEDQTVLHLAAIFHSCTTLMCYILKTCPLLAMAQRTGLFQGQTFLHMLICKERSWTYYNSLTNHVIKEDLKRESIQTLATGFRFVNTPLMGETVLSVAVIKGLKKLITDLLKDGVSLKDQNSKGDTVLHTLIKYAHIKQEERENVLDTLTFLYECMLEPQAWSGTNWGRRYARTVWFTENKDGQTPLQLAAQLGEGEIFTFIMNLQWVYCMLHDHDGLFDINKYDITEVDTIAKLQWIKDKQEEVKDKSFLARFCSQDAFLVGQSSPAVLETICQTDIDEACRIISSPVIRNVIYSKWGRYRYIFYLWASFHLCFMSALSVYAHYKVQLIDFWSSGSNLTENRTGVDESTPAPEDNNFSSSDIKVTFVTGFCVFLFAPLLLFLYMELFRTFVQRKPWQLHLIHHNGSYRLLLLAMFLALLVDSTWFLINPATNHKIFIIVAIICGWWFSMFFLRPYKKFSLFTVMLQKVLFGDMFRFSTVILIQLLAFTVAMRLVFLHNHTMPEEFRDFFYSFLTMFNLMLVGDLSILEKASPAWLAVIIFVLFLLLTYVLLMNSLIATMSSTCSQIGSQKVKLWQVQRLSVILFIEQQLMTFGLARTTGKKNYIVKFENEQEIRYVIEESNDHVSSVNGYAIVRQANYTRDDRFDARLSTTHKYSQYSKGRSRFSMEQYL